MKLLNTIKREIKKEKINIRLAEGLSELFRRLEDTIKFQYEDNGEYSQTTYWDKKLDLVIIIDTDAPTYFDTAEEIEEYITATELEIEILERKLNTIKNA